MRQIKLIFSPPVLLLLLLISTASFSQQKVPDTVMQKIYQEVKTPYKYGLVMVAEKGKMVDSPSVFRYSDCWYMAYIVFDGKGYETWLAKSNDLLNWKTLGKILSFTQNTWDANQKAGYVALQDYLWGGTYEVQKYAGKYWMSYLGGATQGYEAGTLGIGMAGSSDLINLAGWQTLGHPVISAKDADARWYDKETIYKSTVINDPAKTTGYPFVMYYNARGEDVNHGHKKAERISMAVSDDMVTWKRFGNEPVVDHQSGISGDAFISKIDHVWVMFYFGASWRPKAFDRFACSYDLVHWTDWTGDDLVRPSESYDNQYAHKPLVIKYKGIVYHFYCAVDESNHRGIALATSKDIGKSKLIFF
jgi:predicted GH43/DUF377 family glycosyl hydrolase